MITQFEVFKQKKTWYDARRVCRKWGGKLVSVLTPEEQNKVRKMISPHVQAYWIGARKTSKGYRWVDGKSLKFKNWGKGQPDGTRRGHSTCVAIVGGSHWMNANCFHKARFICSKRAELSDVNANARKNEADYLRAHKAELARRAKIVATLADARKQRLTAEDRMKHMAALKAVADAALKTAINLKLAAIKKMKVEKRLAHIARLSLELSVKNRRIADAQARAAVRLSIAAKKRADRNAYLAGVAAGKAKMELARKLREIEKAKVAHAAADIALKAAKKAIKERNHEINLAKLAHKARLAAEHAARDEYKKWQVAVEYTRKMLNKRIKTEKNTHKIMKKQAALTAHAKMTFIKAQVARIAAVKRQHHAEKVWKHMKESVKEQKVKQADMEKHAAYWKAKRDAARKLRDVAITEKKAAHRDMHRDHKLFTVSIAAKKAAEAKLAKAEKLVVHWKTVVTTWSKKYEHQLGLKKKAKKAAKHMLDAMKKARHAADKMEALMKRAKHHTGVARKTLKLTIKVLHAGVHAYKKSVLKWKNLTNKTKKDHAKKEMDLKKAWKVKVHTRYLKMKITLKGFKDNLNKWRLRWIAAKARMNKMKGKSVHATSHFGKVRIIMRKALGHLNLSKKHLKKMITKKISFHKIMQAAKKTLAKNLKRTALRKKHARKMFIAMKLAVKKFKAHKAKMLAALKKAKAQKLATFKAISIMHKRYAEMMSWKAR